jgi:thiol-disulfide isomerase/thioredoxin
MRWTQQVVMAGGSSAGAARPLLLTILVLVAAGAGGFFAYRVFAFHPSITVAPRLVVSPPVAGARDDGGTPMPPARKIPERLPDMAFPDRNGAQRKLSDWKGHPLLINFWATWCDPCRHEIPLLKTLRHERARDGLEVVGIAVDFRDAVTKYAQDIGIDYPVLIGEEGGLQVISELGMQEPVLPFTVFADREGRIVTLKVGELHQEEVSLILDRVRDVDRGHLDLPAAREQIAAGLAKLAQTRGTASEVRLGNPP